MRVKINNIEGRCEVVLIKSAAIALSNDQLKLTLCDNAGIIFVDVRSNYKAYEELDKLLENGWADLSDYSAGLIFPAE